MLWRDVEFGDNRWIIVSTYEGWLMQMLNTISPKDVRRTAKKFVDMFKAEYFMKSLEASRRVKTLPDILDDDDTPTEDSQRRSRIDVRRAVMEISIGGHTVMCLNHATRMSLKLDNKTYAFITAWMVPLMRQVSALPHDVPAVKQMALSQAASPDAKPTFTLSQSPTPNIKDKVHWNPPKNRWDLLLKKAKGVCSELRVDTEQPPTAFASQKIAVYRQAIKQWNLLDGSTRSRIGMDWEE